MVSSFFPLAQGFNWEELLPVIFFVVYGLVQFFGSKKKGSEEVPEEDSEARQAAEERARKIREEIQRRINRRKEEGQTVDRQQEPFRPVMEAHPQRPDLPVPPKMPVERPIAQSSGVNRMEDIQRQIEEQAKKIELGKKQKAAALQKTKQIENGLSHKRKNRQSGTSLDVGNDLDFIRSLRNPIKARQAIIAMEVLGPPKSMQD